MADLIDKQALQSVLDGIVRNYIADKSFQCNFAAGVVCDIRDTVIAEMPTIEAEPVKRGRWVWDSDNDRYVCSRCNKEPSGDCNGGCVSHLSDYCPNCGAKMDLEG